MCRGERSRGNVLGQLAICALRSRWYSVSRAAASACMTTAPCSGVRRPKIAALRFFLGGYDLAMITIRDLLKEAAPAAYFDQRLA